jgi:hypothetical protein
MRQLVKVKSACPRRLAQAVRDVLVGDSRAYCAIVNEKSILSSVSIGSDFSSRTDLRTSSIVQNCLGGRLDDFLVPGDLATAGGGLGITAVV